MRRATERVILSKHTRTENGEVEELETSVSFISGLSALCIDAAFIVDGELDKVETVVLDFNEMGKLIEEYQKYRGQEHV